MVRVCVQVVVVKVHVSGTGMCKSGCGQSACEWCRYVYKVVWSKCMCVCVVQVCVQVGEIKVCVGVWCQYVYKWVWSKCV